MLQYNIDEGSESLEWYKAILEKVKKEYKECEIYGCEKGNQTFCERPVQF